MVCILTDKLTCLASITSAVSPFLVMSCSILLKGLSGEKVSAIGIIFGGDKSPSVEDGLEDIHVLLLVTHLELGRNSKKAIFMQNSKLGNNLFLFSICNCFFTPIPQENKIT